MASLVKAQPAFSSLLLGLILVILGCGALPAAAATDQKVEPNPSPVSARGGITISPTLKELTLSSGLIEANSTIVLTNNTGRDLSATLKPVDFRSLNDYGGVSFGQAGLPVSKYALAKWIVLPGGNTVQLPNGKSTNVLTSIQNRTDLSPGGHYGAIVVQVGTSPNAKGYKVNFKQELVSLIFVKKLGGEHYGLQIESLSAKKGSVHPEEVYLRFRSTGNVHVVPRGYVTVTDPKGVVISKGIINPESTLVLPGTSRAFTTTMQTVGKSQRTGRYTITAYYRHSEQSQFSTKSIYVNNGGRSYLPPLIILLVAVFAGLGVRKITRMRK